MRRLFVIIPLWLLLMTLALIVYRAIPPSEQAQINELRERVQTRHEAKARRYAEAYGAAPQTIAQIADRERARREGEQDRGQSSEEDHGAEAGDPLGIPES